MGARRGTLIALGEGVYTVAEITRILQPTMNDYKVRYWLDKGLLGNPIRRGSRGRPHLLSFEQLLRIRTIQHLRDKLNLPLQRITPAIKKLSNVPFTNKEWHNLHLFRTDAGRIGVSDGDETYEVETDQLIIPEAVVSELEGIVRETRRDWARGEIVIEEFPWLVSNAGIVAGSPTIRGTRVETSFIAHMVRSLGVNRVLQLYPYLDRESLIEAVRFEGIESPAA